MALPVSIVIRSLNEEIPLQRLFAILKKQHYEADMELVVVDNESHDNTAKIAIVAGAKVVNIPRDEFSYPHSMNIGVAAATHDVVVLIVAHAFPFSNNWLAAGMEHFKDSQVAGVYANVIPYDGASQEELDFYMPNYVDAKKRGSYTVDKGSMGVLGATNCIIRKSLWEQHNFDEKYGLGGEDGEWASWALSEGYTIINDYQFSVKHSHSFRDGGLEKQIEYWQSLGGPQGFDKDRLRFRSDISFD